MRRVIHPPEAEHFEAGYAAAGNATFILPLGEAIRIRTGERGSAAV